MLTPKSFGSNLLAQRHNHLSHNEMQCFNLRSINDDDDTEDRNDTDLRLSEKNLNYLNLDLKWGLIR
jgi:hypothetical protein